MHDPTFLALLAIYTVASIICFFAYAADKAAAREGRRRTPERTLLLLGLVGGWPGAVLAQTHLRHKSSKNAFLTKFWITVAINMGVLLALKHYKLI
jgi:uncharacterized membrane protein YsdA (DUF1294 family)